MQSHRALVQRRQLDEISELPAALGCLDTEAGRHDQAASRLLCRGRFISMNTLCNYGI